MRRMKSSPICMLISLDERAIFPVKAIWVGMSLQVSIVLSTSSSKREVWLMLVIALLRVTGKEYYLYTLSQSMRDS